MARTVSLSTPDNPFSPISDFDQWYEYDLAHGRDTAGYLARVARLSDSMPPYYYNAALEDAIDEIIDLNGPEMYVKVVEND